MAKADRDAVLRARKRVPPPGGALLEDTEKMKQKHHRMLCAFCALVILVSTVFPTAAFAEQPVDAAAAEQTLTRADAAEMQQADAAVTALTESEQYQEMDTDARKDAALARLDTLAAKGLVEKDSIYTDEENGMVSFRYPCGVLGGILLTEPEDETLDEENAGTETAASNHALSLRLPPDLGAEMQTSRAALLRRTENQAVEKFGTAVIYYAFDNTINSSRFPYYSYMQGFWSALGLETKINIHVTVADLKKMGNYNVSVLSAHGSYYTYSYGKFLKRTRTEPIMLLTEESTFGKDLRYGFDLLAHRVIKVNGMYCVTSDFFRNAYKGGKLSNTIVYSETCEFLGVDGSEDNAMAGHRQSSATSTTSTPSTPAVCFGIPSITSSWGRMSGRRWSTPRRLMVRMTSSGTMRRAADVPMQRLPMQCSTATARRRSMYRRATAACSARTLRPERCTFCKSILY